MSFINDISASDVKVGSRLDDNIFVIKSTRVISVVK